MQAFQHAQRGDVTHGAGAENENADADNRVGETDGQPEIGDEAEDRDCDSAKLREEEESGIGALSGFQNRCGIAFGRAENPPEEKQTQRARSGERKEAEPAIFQGDLNCIEKPESPQPRQRNRGRPCDGILRVQACLSPESLGLNHESRWFRDSPIHECDPFGEAGDLRVAIGADAAASSERKSVPPSKQD